jgi:hypothetical protein
MASVEASQPTPYRRDEQGKFSNAAAEPDSSSAKPAGAPSPDATHPQFTSLLSHVGALAHAACISRLSNNVDPWGHCLRKPN